ncbi:MAG: hypothetical protein LAP87_23960 [Acidobacteriia bacterium]|nr:hypothetical protein [Terriglobia bacterium]
MPRPPVPAAAGRVRASGAAPVTYRSPPPARSIARCARRDHAGGPATLEPLRSSAPASFGIAATEHARGERRGWSLARVGCHSRCGISARIAPTALSEIAQLRAG